jgi:Flp pilus assembly protein TadB
MSQLLDVALLTVGASSCGAAVWFVAHSTLSRRWTRQWVLFRLNGTSHHAPSQKQQERSSVADFLDAIAREVHSGYSLTLAFVNTAERFPSFAWWTEPISLHCIRGHSIATAIAETSPQNWTVDVALATRTLSVASNGGYGIVGALEKSASILREREHIAHERRAQTAQIRLSTAVLSWIPLVICAWVITRQSHTRTFLLHTPLGLLCIAFGLLFNIAGRKWITQIARNST